MRHYVCPRCNTGKGNPQVLMEKLLAKKQDADTECDRCGYRFPLWDALEKQFASAKTREQVEGLKAGDAVKLDSRRKGKLLALEVGARITSADQKCFEIPATEDEGLDMELEFTDDQGKGTGRRLYLQLKCGNSWLRRRKDGVEIFTIKKQGWVKNWLKQPHPVMLVIGTFPEEGRPLIRAPRQGQTPIRRRPLDGDQLRPQARKPERQETGQTPRIQRRAAGYEQHSTMARSSPASRSARPKRARPRQRSPLFAMNDPQETQWVPVEQVQQLILLARGEKVLLDTHLARLYGVTTGALNRAVRRNAGRFPPDFMFQLTVGEARILKCQTGISSPGHGGRRRSLPYAFTEQGVAMLSSVLRSERAVQVNVAIMRAFVSLRRMLAGNEALARKLAELERGLEGHDQAIKTLFDAIRQLMSPPAEPKREIGFHIKEDSVPYRVKRNQP